MDRKEYKDRVDNHNETSDRLDDHEESTDLLYNPIESRDRLDDRKESREHEEECKEIKIEIDLFESSADSLVQASIRKPKQESALKEEFTGLHKDLNFLIIMNNVTTLDVQGRLRN